MQVWPMATDLHVTTGTDSKSRLIVEENAVHNCESVHELFLHTAHPFGSHS